MRALICGVTGQDGALLTRLLLSKGYEVVGTSRDSQVSSFANLSNLAIDMSLVKLVSMAPNDFRSVLQAIKLYKPDEIYNLLRHLKALLQLRTTSLRLCDFLITPYVFIMLDPVSVLGQHNLLARTN
jgi:putative NADH-flavin reductase